MDVTITKVGEPLWNVADLRVLEELMDAASAQTCRCRNLANGEAGVMGCNDGPDTFTLGFFETRRGQLQPVFQLSFMLDKLVEFFTGWSHGQSIRGYGPGVQQTGRLSVLFCSVTTGKPDIARV